MELVFKVRDERGEELDAHLMQAKGDGYTWHVKLVSEKGVRGMFTMDIPAGITEEAAISKRLQDEGIHARN